jgi:hypothetical protein
MVDDKQFRPDRGPMLPSNAAGMAVVADGTDEAARMWERRERCACGRGLMIRH